MTWSPDALLRAKAVKRLAIKQIATATGLSEKTVSRVLKGDPAVKWENVLAVAQVLDVKEDDLLALGGAGIAALNPLSGMTMLPMLVQTLSQAVRFAMDWAWRCAVYPNLAGRVWTPTGKITGLERSEDPTHALDLVTSRAIRQALLKAREMAGNPLGEGFVLVDEETGVQGMVNESGDAEWAIVVDSADDTASLRLGLGGTILVAAYRRNVGWVAAVAGDLTRSILFWRCGRAASSAIVLLRSRLEDWALGAPAEINWAPVEGHPIPLQPSDSTTLRGGSLNLYLGKPARILDARKTYRNLLADCGVAACHSLGGSMGPLLVSQGLLIASVEALKGFKVLDATCGLYIAHGAGTHVWGLDGQPLSFGVDPVLEQILADHHDAERSRVLLEKHRLKFVAACTRDVAAEALAALAK
jgi:transcriptional regulator with XRE-family HTH domain/fructose-1,6-bisphosphatase/inositol monophosphatase family enzyme